MKNNRRRKFTTYKFFVEGQMCKIFFHPQKEFKKGFWIWNVGFAVGKSNRQLNDLYWKKQNKRSRSIHRQITGRVGMKAVTKFFKEIVKLRWLIEPGDVFYCDCTSSKPEQQFRIGLRFLRNHPDWAIDYENLIFFWHRPPYYDDVIWDDFIVLGNLPPNPLQSTDYSQYYDCFRAFPKDQYKAKSKDQN